MGVNVKEWSWREPPGPTHLNLPGEPCQRHKHILIGKRERNSGGHKNFDDRDGKHMSWAWAATVSDEEELLDMVKKGGCWGFVYRIDHVEKEGELIWERNSTSTNPSSCIKCRGSGNKSMGVMSYQPCDCGAQSKEVEYDIPV